MQLSIPDDRTKVLYYGQLLPVSKEEPDTTSVALGPTLIPEELIEDLFSHRTSIMHDFHLKSGCMQWTHVLKDVAYRITAMKGVIYVVRRLTF